MRAGRRQPGGVGGVDHELGKGRSAGPSVTETALAVLPRITGGARKEQKDFETKGSGDRRKERRSTRVTLCPLFPPTRKSLSCGHQFSQEGSRNLGQDGPNPRDVKFKD